MTDDPRQSKQEISTLDLIRRYLTLEEQERLRELEAAATAIQAELTPDEKLRLVGFLSRGLFELISEREEEQAIQLSSAVTPEQQELLERAGNTRSGRGGSSPASEKRSASRKRKRYVGACAECGSQAGLHALSCSRYRSIGEPPPLTKALVAELRALPASQWSGWPPDEYDQGLPVVEIRQDHLAALLLELEQARRRNRS